MALSTGKVDTGLEGGVSLLSMKQNSNCGLPGGTGLTPIPCCTFLPR